MWNSEYIFLNISFVCMCISMCVCMHFYEHASVKVPSEARRERIWMYWKWRYTGCKSSNVVLGTEPWASVRSANALNQWVISPPQIKTLKKLTSDMRAFPFKFPNKSTVVDYLHKNRISSKSILRSVEENLWSESGKHTRAVAFVIFNQFLKCINRSKSIFTFLCYKKTISKVKKAIKCR